MAEGDERRASRPPYHLAVAFGPEVGTPAQREALETMLTAHLPIDTRTNANEGSASVLVHGERIEGWRMEALAAAAEENEALVVLDGPLFSSEEVVEAEHRVCSGVRALRRLFGPSGVLLPRQLAIVDALSSIGGRERDEYVRVTLGPILGQRRVRAERLLATIEGSIRGNSTVEVAEAMHLHTKTISYRRRTIAALTGFQLSHPPDRFHLTLAFYLWRLGEAASEMPALASPYWLEPTGSAAAGRTLQSFDPGQSQ